MGEHHIEENIEDREDFPETERGSLIVARRGQGGFNDRVMGIEKFCRVPKVETQFIYGQATASGGAIRARRNGRPWRTGSC
jgi:hypothetical protein